LIRTVKKLYGWDGLMLGLNDSAMSMIMPVGVVTPTIITKDNFDCI